MDQQIRFCTAPDGVRIAYATVGSGPPLVKAVTWLSHLEFGWHSPIWRHWLEGLAAGCRLVHYDGRGCGLSDWDVEDLSFEAWVRDLEAVVDALDLDRFPLLGISQGGPVSVAYAVRHPERVTHLIIYGAYARGWANRGQEQAVIVRNTMMMLTKQGWGKDNPVFRQIWTVLDMPEATPEQMRWFDDLQRASTSPDNAVRFQAEFGKIDVRDLLSQVKVPTLVLHCRDDAVAPFEEGRLLAARIPNARFVPLEGKNHHPLEGDPCWKPLIAEVQRFLGARGDDTGADAPTESVHAGRLLGDARPGPLTPREREVAGLVARGLSNREIADALVITERTAESHVQHILDKMEFNSRSQIATWAAERGLHKRA